MKTQFMAALGVLLAVSVLGTTCFGASVNSKDYTNVRKVEINTSAVTVRVNQTRTLFALITPADADDQGLAWDTSNPDVVSVDGEGVITGISPGTAEITATSHNGRTGRCVVTVPGAVVTYLEEETSGGEEPRSQLSGAELAAATVQEDVAKAVKAANSGETPVVSYSGRTFVSAAALRGAAYAAQYNGGAVLLRFVTPEAQSTAQTDIFAGAEAQGWIQMDPGKMGSGDGEIGLCVYTQADKISSVQEKARQTLGSNAAVLQLSHQGGFPFEVTVWAKADLSGLDTRSLRLYSYNSANSSYTLLENQDYGVTDSGYLRFHTATGGHIVITNQSV